MQGSSPWSSPCLLQQFGDGEEPPDVIAGEGHGEVGTAGGADVDLSGSAELAHLANAAEFGQRFIKAAGKNIHQAGGVAGGRVVGGEAVAGGDVLLARGQFEDELLELARRTMPGRRWGRGRGRRRVPRRGGRVCARLSSVKERAPVFASRSREGPRAVGVEGMDVGDVAGLGADGLLGTEEQTGKFDVIPLPAIEGQTVLHALSVDGGLIGGIGGAGFKQVPGEEPEEEGRDNEGQGRTDGMA